MIRPETPEAVRAFYGDRDPRPGEPSWEYIAGHNIRENAKDRVRMAAAVREAIEQHGPEVVELVGGSETREAMVRYARATARDALECLLARVEGKPWAGGAS